MPTIYEYSIAFVLFGCRESPDELFRTLCGIQKASNNFNPRIDIIVNGNEELAHAVHHLIQTQPISDKAHEVHVWHIEYANKANAWNQYVHRISVNRDVTFFVDGYIDVTQQMVEIAIETFATQPDALCVSGYPCTGRSAEEIKVRTLNYGGLHGNFFGLSRTCIESMQRRNINLPIGLYGFDTVLGGFLGFGLNPAEYSWDMKRYVACPSSCHWTLEPKDWKNHRHVKTQLLRIKNNALRSLVRKATHYYLAREKRPPESLPNNINDFINNWARANPNDLFRTFLDNPLTIFHYLKFCHPFRASGSTSAISVAGVNR